MYRPTPHYYSWIGFASGLLLVVVLTRRRVSATSGKPSAVCEFLKIDATAETLRKGTAWKGKLILIQRHGQTSKNVVLRPNKVPHPRPSTRPAHAPGVRRLTTITVRARPRPPMQRAAEHKLDLLAAEKGDIEVVSTLRDVLSGWKELANEPQWFDDVLNENGIGQASWIVGATLVDPTVEKSWLFWSNSVTFATYFCFSGGARWEGGWRVHSRTWPGDS